MSDAAEGPKIPAIVVGYDPATQKVQLQFDSKQFRTWDFVIAVLEMAKMQADHIRRESIENAKIAAMMAEQENASRIVVPQ